MPLKGIDIIIHCAAVMPRKTNNYLEIAEKNKKIDRNIIKFAKKNNSKLIYISGTSLYGDKIKKEVKENQVLDIGSNQYFAQKKYSENLFLKELETSTILRISAPYHPSMKANTVLKIFITRAFKNQDLYYYGKGNRVQDFTHTHDIANAILKNIKNTKIKGIYNIASGTPISMKNLAHLIVKKMPNCTSKILPIGKPDPQEDYRAFFNISKAKKNLNWIPKITIENGVINWIKNLN